MNVTSPEALDGVLKRGRLLIADMREAGATAAADEAAKKLDAIQSQRDASVHP